MRFNRTVLASGVLLAIPLVAVVLVGVRPDTSTFRVPSGAMLPTVKVGQHVRVEKGQTGIQLDDIVVFHPPSGAEGTGDTCGNPARVAGRACDRPTAGPASVMFIKRVAALPGDRISIRGGHVIRNGARVRDAYVAPCAGGSACNLPKTIVIPAGHYFLLGDNRGASDDSRFWGPVPRAWMVGRVVDCGVLALTCRPLR